MGTSGWNLTAEDLIKRTLAHRPQRLSMDDLRSVKTCSWDIETTNLALDGGIILCGSVKRLFGPMKTFRIDQSPNYAARPWDDSWVTIQLRDELEKYDVVAHHYGDRFDVPALQTRLLRHRLRMLGTSAQVYIDTWWQARYRLRLHSNRLASLISLLDTKTHKTGLDLTDWTEATCGKASSLNKVVVHNRKDVQALEEVLIAFSAFMPLKYSVLR